MTEITNRKAYCIDEACHLLGGICRKTIYDLINAGDLRTVKIKNRRLVPEWAIDELLKRNESVNEPQK